MPSAAPFSGMVTGGWPTLVALAASVMGLVLSVALLSRWVRRLRPAALPPLPWRAPELVVVGGVWLLLQMLPVIAAGSGLSSSERAAGDASRLVEIPWLWIRGEMRIVVRYALAALGALAFSGVLLGMAAGGRERARVLGIGTASVRDGALKALVAYVLLLPAAHALLVLWPYFLDWVGIPVAEQSVIELLRAELALGNRGFVALMGGIAIVCAPIQEELLFRAVLHRMLSRALGSSRGALLSGALFGALHATIAGFLPLMLLGVLLALIYERSGSLWPCVALHSLFNAVQFGLMLAIS